MRILVIGGFNTDLLKIQYPCTKDILYFNEKYPEISFHFIDPHYDNNNDIVLNNIIKSFNNCYIYPLTLLKFKELYLIKEGDIVLDFSGSWDYFSLKKKLDIITDSNKKYILLALSCGCNNNLYTLIDNNKKYIDYKNLFGKMIIEPNNYLQYHPPNIIDIFNITNYDNVLEFIVNYSNNLLNYSKYLNKYDNGIINEKENILYINNQISNWINNIRWFILGNTKIKPHYNKNISKDNYFFWYQALKQLFEKICPDNDITFKTELLSIIELYPNNKFNFKLIAKDINTFYKSKDKTKFLSELNYNNYIQYEIYILDDMLTKFKLFIKNINK